MGLKCSMFGHSYGDPEVEREREEDGDEVVVTVREIKVCSRCGAESVVSENKEVTTLREPRSADEAAANGEPSAPETAGDEPPTRDVDADDEDAELIGEDEPVFEERGESEDDATDPDADPATPSETAPEAADNEDAAIIDGESEASEESDDEDPPVADPEDLLPEQTTADNGEGAANESETTDEPSEGGVSDGRAGSEAAREDDDGVILDEEPPAPDRDHGEWPDSEDVGSPPANAETEKWPDDPGTPDATEAGAAETGATEANAGVVDTGIESAGRAPSPDSAPNEETGAELFCPSCSYTAALDRASLRVGDICPECKRGYLSER